MGEATDSRTPAPVEGPNHAKRLALICVVLTLVSAPIGLFVLGPTLPPGTQTFQDDNQVWVNSVILAFVLPIFLCIIAAFVYAFIEFRARSGVEGDAPPIVGNRRVQRWWIGGTAAIVVFLWAFGTYEWIWAGAGSGGGQGPVPLVKPDEDALEVQVIGQQWAFTYRYPSYGGFETPHMVLPDGQYVEIHVTSLDVIHSFWAIELGAKADATPGFDNVLYLEPLEAGTFRVKCAELCGLWHGQMYDEGEIVAASEFDAWATQQRSDFADITRYLPAYAHTYQPEPTYRGG